MRLLRLRDASLVALLAGTVVLAPVGRAKDGGGEGRDLELSRAWERRVQEVIARVASTVTTVSVEADEGRSLSSGGSGVIVDPQGYVLTNDHVTEGKDAVRVGLADGRTLDGRVVGRDEDGDVAVIELPVGGLPAASLGDSERLRAGDPVLALGNPFGLARDDHVPAATLGVVSATDRYLGGKKIYGDAIQIDASVNPGNSGGPLFDLSGRLVGINGRISIRGTARHNVGVGFAVPIHQIELVLERLKSGEDVQRGYLGVRFFVHDDGRQGVIVRDVVPGSPAQAHGLQAGDRILSVDGKAIDHPVRLQNHLTVLPEGTKVPLTVRRDGQELEVEVVLGERPGS